MTRSLGLAAGLGVLLAVGCAPAQEPEPVDTSADVAAINQLITREIAMFSSGDLTELSAVFAPDVVVMAPNEPAIQGRDALGSWANGIHAQFTVGVQYTSSDVSVSGDLAVHRFTGVLSMTPKAGGEGMSETVKGLHILRRQADGSWLITQDVWNADQPPPAMPAGGH
ncbi:MAG TPA: SgcJ/EcaC family oxidoreductase [Vicinamibacterales bacterium]|nr:SgcJ/EcaC family oxidoreductase [Vicinamibacterales bacterium]